MQSLQLLTLNEVAKLLGRRPETVRKDIIRNPYAVPPRLVIPGTRLLRWRMEDIESWLTECAASARGEQ